jgi:hypothetical protein
MSFKSIRFGAPRKEQTYGLAKTLVSKPKVVFTNAGLDAETGIAGRGLVTH